MIRALVRAGWRTRLMLVVVVLLSAGLTRVVAALAGDQPWGTGEFYDAMTSVILCLVMPTFVALLGTMLLRGEHAPWHFTLARPATRAGILAVLVAMDAVAIAASVGAAAVVFEGFGRLFVPGVRFVPPWLLVSAAYVLIYFATAIGGARRMSSLRAGALGLVWVAVLGVLARFVIDAGALFESRLRIQVRSAKHYGELFPNDHIPEHLIAYAFVAVGLLAVACVAIGVAIPFVRAAASVPASPRWRTLLVPSLVAFAVCFAAAAGIASFVRLVAH
jgi:hypothetical protein